MDNKEAVPHGYIYRANNHLNGKNYLGQTVTSRWGEGKIPIEERWKEEIQEAYRKEQRGENLRYIERAITKYGSENFDLEEEDVAYSQEELDEKETYWVKEYDSMNPEKGYNMTEGGLGGRISAITKEYISKKGKEKWQNDDEWELVSLLDDNSEVNRISSFNPLNTEEQYHCIFKRKKR